MKFDNVKLEMPFQCNPTKPWMKCELYFNIHADDQADSTVMTYLSDKMMI